MRSGWGELAKKALAPCETSAFLKSTYAVLLYWVQLMQSPTACAASLSG